MPKKNWTVNFEDGQHAIELDHGSVTGKRAICIDGSPLPIPASESLKPLDTGSRLPFTLSGHACTVVIRTNGITFSYDLEVDGRSVTTGNKSNERETSQKSVVSVLLIYGVIFAIYAVISAHRPGFLYHMVYWLAPLPFVCAAYYAVVPDDPQDFSQMRRPRFWGLMLACVVLGFMSTLVLS